LRELDEVQCRLADDLWPVMLVHLEEAWGSGEDAVSWEAEADGSGAPPARSDRATGVFTMTVIGGGSVDALVQAAAMWVCPI
jgi:hypothetical protein